MLPIAIHADCALTPFEEIPDAVIVIQGSKIIAVGQRGKVAMPRGAREVAAKGKTVVPGFVDVHIHGAGGHDVMEGTSEALEIIAATVALHGTTSIVATTVTASQMEICRSVGDIARFILESGLSPARELAAVAGRRNVRRLADVRAICRDRPDQRRAVCAGGCNRGAEY